MFTLNQLSLIQLEQIALNLKAGIPLIYKYNNSNYLLFALESLNASEFQQMMLEANEIKLVITKDRMKYIGIETIDHVIIDIENDNFDKISEIAGINLSQSKQINYLSLPSKVSTEFNAIIDFTIMQELIPALILIKPKDSRIYHNFLHIDIDAINYYQTSLSRELTLVSKADLKVEFTDKKLQLYCFQSLFSSSEHYAIIVGEAKEDALVRLHSSCYTGDLLSSISCDCCDQFHLALNKMTDHPEGGILLYLIQEGRGIGLINKLRSYNLQAQGLDTMDANLALGFPNDARILWPAAKMLEILNIKKIKLMTNNPKKINELKNLGIEVTETVRHQVELNEESKKYMDVKIEKMGHLN